MPRGGRRPGAGAPKGNLNALKTGKTSRQYQRLIEILSQDPEAVRLVREIVLGDEARKRRRRREAIAIVNHILERFEYDRNDRIADAYEASRDYRRALNLPPGDEDDDWSYENE